MFLIPRKFYRGATINNMTVPLDEFPVFIKQGAWVLSVAENQLLADPMKVYPNPTSGKFSLSFFSQKKSFLQMKIFDLSGREVLLLPKTNVQVIYKYVDINASSFENGTYFYK